MPGVVPGGRDDLVTRQARLLLAAELERPLMMFAGTEADEMMMIHEKPDSASGTISRVEFRVPDYTSTTKPDGGTLIGDEAQSSYEYDQLRMDYHKFDGKVPNGVTEQNVVNWDLVDGEVDRVGELWAINWERWILHQLAGNVAATASAPGSASHFPLSGSNTITAYDSAHIVRAKLSDDTIPANDSSFNSTALETTETIDRCLLVARSRKFGVNKYPIAPCKTPWGKKYLYLTGPEGLSQLTSNDPRNLFIPLQEAVLAGGADYYESAVANLTGYIYKNVAIVEINGLDDPDYPIRGLSGTTAVANTKVSIFAGACSGQWVFGKGFTDGDHIGFVEEKIKRFYCFDADTNCGFKRTIPIDTAQTFGSLRVTSYSEVT